MKTRKTKTETEKPSSEEEDASSDDSIKITSKKSAKQSAKRRNVKLPLMDLSRNDVPLDGQELARALMVTSDTLRERSLDESDITLHELTRCADIPIVVAWLRKWDDSLEDYTCTSRVARKKLLSKYTFEQFFYLFEKQGKDPYEEGKFLQLVENIKYASTEEALRDMESHWLEWLQKADRQFDAVPAEFQSERIVSKLIGWCAEPLKSFLGNLRTELKNEQSPRKDSPEVYIDQVSELAKLLKQKDSLSKFSRSLMEELTSVRKQSAAKIAVLEAEVKALKKGKETSGGRSGDGKRVPSQFGGLSKEEHVTRIKNRYPSLMGNTEYQQIVDKYDGFYRTCVNCGKSDMKKLPCGCGKNGEKSSDPKVREMHADFEKCLDFRVAAPKGAK